MPDSARWPPWLHGYYAESTVFNRFLKFFFDLGNSNDFQRCSTYLQCCQRSWWNPNDCRRKHPLAMVYQNVSSQMENTLFAFHYHEWPRRYGNAWFLENYIQVAKKSQMPENVPTRKTMFLKHETTFRGKFKRLQIHVFENHYFCKDKFSHVLKRLCLFTMASLFADSKPV